MDMPILKNFRIYGLHGYKDVSIDFPSGARILIAGNGSGKTTIFNALYSVLSVNFFRLATLHFSYIACQFYDDDTAVIIHKADLADLPSEVNPRVAQLVARIPGVSEDEVMSFLQVEYEIGGFEKQLRESTLLNNIYVHMPGDYKSSGALLDDIATTLRGGLNAALAEASARVKRAMGGIQVLYLPTYRRIELPLINNKKKASLGRNSGEDQIFAETSSETRHINFGLTDVERRLNELSESVERQSNFEYRTISATILDEALADQIETVNSSLGLPDIDALRRFLSRVASEPFDYLWAMPGRIPRINQEKNDGRMNAIEALYKSGDIYSERQRILRYFLIRLGSVIEKTQATEAILQRFVEACNKYLGDSIDEKIFTYDPNAARVKVINSWTETEIPLGNLSSGEKQIVSILAKLFLYSQEKFVLIDEPELSLSLEWQKRILPDMLESGSVRQLFAITHSPFIFDNYLDPCAGAMRVARSERPGNI